MTTVGFGPAEDQLNTGMACYAALTTAAEGFLARRVAWRELLAAGQLLADRIG